jgi:hypothetical protein
MLSLRRSLVMLTLFLTPIPVALMMEALLFTETSVLSRVMWRNIPEDGILLSHLKPSKLYSVISSKRVSNPHVSIIPRHIDNQQQF